jgi:cytoskeleton protein RodZ
MSGPTDISATQEGTSQQGIAPQGASPAVPAPEAAVSPAPPVARSIGERLRAGRERSGLSVAAAAEKLHLDPKVIEALEADRFAEVGASVYVRGHLRRYADFVGEPGVELVNVYSARSEARPPPPDLTQIPQAERRSDPRRLVTPLVGLGCALVLALAIWWVLSGSNTPGKQSSAAATPPPVPTPAPATPTAAPPAALASTADTASPGKTAQPNASAPAAAQPTTTAREEAAPARATRLRLELSSESWVEVYDSRGQRLFYDVAGAGSVQSIEGRPPLRVVLGNAAAVAVQVDGQPREIPSNSLDGEGARFVINRAGNLSRSRQ